MDNWVIILHLKFQNKSKLWLILTKFNLQVSIHIKLEYWIHYYAHGKLNLLIFL